MPECADMGCSPMAPCQRCLEAAFDDMAHSLEVREQVSFLPNGHVITRNVDDDGRLHDGVNGSALTERDASGVLRFELHALHGVETDLDDRPAHLWTYPNGAPHVVEHMVDGALCDVIGPHGFAVPAVTWFMPNGRIMKAESWNHGVRER